MNNLPPYFKDVQFLINIKVQKEGSANNAIAAINILHKDYVETNPDKEKCYMLIKTMYSFDTSKIDKERKILIKGIDGYCLEEIDFSSGHKQDHRNWSEKFNPNSGRLQASKKFRKDNLLRSEDISYELTKEFIASIFQNNEVGVTK